MINLHESMVPGRDRTRDPWIYSQTRICSQTRYRLRYAARSSSALCFIFKSMINNPEFCQFILQVQSGVIYFYNLNNNFRNPTVQNLSQFHSLVSSRKLRWGRVHPSFEVSPIPSCISLFVEAYIPLVIGKG